MRSRTTSPQPEVVRLRAFKWETTSAGMRLPIILFTCTILLYTMPLYLRKTLKALFDSGEKPTHVSLEPPKIQALEFYPSKISRNGMRDFMSDPNLATLTAGGASTTNPRTPQHNGGSLAAPFQVNGDSSASPRSLQTNGDDNVASRTLQPHDTPTKQPPNEIRFSSAPPSEADGLYSSQLLSSEPGTPTSEVGGIPWSAAVGRASLGKSGRVIDRLMGDNDRLKRDKTLATAKLEEEVKKSESARSTVEALETSNANLQSMHEIDKAALTRKDRKIEEMRTELEAERARREKAEAEVKVTRREREEAVEKYKKEAMREQEESRYASTQYDVLSKSWKSMEANYQRQTQKLRADIKSLHESIARDQQKLSHLEVITEQLRQEGDKAKRAKEMLFDDFQAYKQEQSKSLGGIKERAQRNDITNDQLLREVESVLGQMRYVVNLKKVVRDAE